MKKLFLIICFLSFLYGSYAQVAPDKYWVRFTNRFNSPYSIENPGEFLSQRAIDRRAQFNIPIVENDLPVNPQYIQAVANTGVTILNASKWFNSVTIYTTDPNALDQISQFDFVLSVSKAGGKPNGSGDFVKEYFANESFASGPEESSLKSISAGDSYDYGEAFNQIHMLNGEVLHDMGYDGAGKIIAVLDAGFLNANNIDAFDSLWNNGQILGTRDFVSPQNPNIFGSHYHGTMVLSTMGANWPGQIVGTAPKADYWLIRTEDGDSEYLIEELNWVSGAELADSLGADIINSSLGYTTFDDPALDHSYEDMDGNTTPVTIGADMAVSKGMIVVNSAGNSGGSFWQYIGAPADGDSVFSIGAVDGSGNYAGFSSTGPTFDGRMKPNVVAQGQGSTIIDPWTGSVSSGSGTSFSSPITAGMVACLWQANPTKRNTEILEAIQQSGSQANNPDYFLGYGIPDYALANSILTVIENEESPMDLVSVYPNPFSNEITIHVGEDNSTLKQIELMDITGKSLMLKNYSANEDNVVLNNISNLSAGFYLLKITLDQVSETRKLLKK
jgi:serine protease AprX